MSFNEHNTLEHFDHNEQKVAAIQTSKSSTRKQFNYAVDRRPACNSTYKKLAVQWLIEHLCFVSSVVLAESFVLSIRHLRQAPNR
jgi:hypothetical protein